MIVSRPALTEKLRNHTKVTLTQDECQYLALELQRPVTATPLWQYLATETGVELNPTQWKTMFTRLATEIDSRGSVGLDRDPGETSDWLLHEAERTGS